MTATDVLPRILQPMAEDTRAGSVRWWPDIESENGSVAFPTQRDTIRVWREPDGRHSVWYKDGPSDTTAEMTSAPGTSDGDLLKELYAAATESKARLLAWARGDRKPAAAGHR